MGGPPQASSGFFGGLYGVIGPKIAEMQANEQKSRDLQAKMYLDAIQSGRLTPEQLDYAHQQIQKIYGHAKPIKALLGKVGDAVNRLTGHGQPGQGGQGDQGGQAAPAAPGIPAPPQTASTAPSGPDTEASPTMTLSPDMIPKPPQTGMVIPRTGHEYRGQPGTDDLVASPTDRNITPAPMSERVPGVPNMTSAGPVPALPPPPGFAGIVGAAYPSQSILTNEAVARQNAIDTAQFEFQRTHHINEFERTRKEIQEAFPNMSPQDVEKATARKLGMLPRSLLTKTIQDSTSPTGWTEVSYDPYTNEEFARKQGARPPIASLGRPAWTMKDGKPVQVMLDRRTGQPIPGTENSDVVPPSYMLPHIKQGEFSWTDDDGVLHRAPTTSTTSPVLPGGKGASSTPKSPAAPKGIPAPPGSGSSPAAAAGRVIGQTLSKTDAALQKQAIKDSEDVKTMATLLKTQQDYMDGITKGTAQPSPRQDLSLIVAAVRAMNPGTVRLPQKELELELKAGSFGDRFRRWYDTATEGTLPPDQRNDLFRVVRNETTNAGKNAAGRWDQVFQGKKSKPVWLIPFSGPAPVGGGGTAGAASLDDQIMQAVQGAKAH